MPRTKPRALLVRQCGQLLTLRGPSRARRGKEMADPGLIQHGAILIQDDLIVRVGRDRDAARWPEARGAFTIDAGGRVVLPGFADSHTHALFAASRVDDYVARLQGATYRQLGTTSGIQTSAEHIKRAKEASLRRRLQHSITL